MSERPHIHEWRILEVYTEEFPHGTDTGCMSVCECGLTRTLWATGVWTLEEIETRKAAGGRVFV